MLRCPGQEFFRADLNPEAARGFPPSWPVRALRASCCSPPEQIRGSGGRNSDHGKFPRAQQ